MSAEKVRCVQGTLNICRKTGIAAHLSGELLRSAQTGCHTKRILMIACTHVNEGKRCGAKKWCPVILNGVASFVILNGAFGGVKDLGHGIMVILLPTSI